MRNIASSISTGIAMLVLAMQFNQVGLGQTASAPTPEAPSLEAQDKDAKKNHKLRPLIDDPGTDCFPYTLDVVSLKDNNHQMFWKQGDCIVVHVTNNPFLFQYVLKFDEQLIKEDDPLSTFGAKFGLNVSGVANSGANTDTKAADTSKSETAKESPAKDVQLTIDNSAQQLAGEGVRTLGKDTVNSLFEIAGAGKRGDYQLVLDDKQKLPPGTLDKLSKNPATAPIAKSLNDFDAKVAPPTDFSTWRTEADSLKAKSDLITQTYELIKSGYRSYGESVAQPLATLRDPKAPLSAVREAAQGLLKQAVLEYDCLTDGILDAAHSRLVGCKSDDAAPANSITLEHQLLEFARMAAHLHKEIQPTLGSVNQNDAAQASQISDRLHAAGMPVAYIACADKALRDHDFSSIRDGIIAPLNLVVPDILAFEYVVAAKKREGPWPDPEAVTLSLHRDPVNLFASASGDSKTVTISTSSYSCSSDTADMFDHGESYSELNDFFTDKPVEGKTNTYVRNQNKPSASDKPGDQTAQNGSAKPVTAAKTDITATQDNKVLVQPWFFGRARLVVTGGLSSGFLAKQEFQRSSSIAGTGSTATSSTVIGLKTDTRLRFTPMLYGHTLLYSGRHNSDAWYATVGVTANSDNKGTDPEFLLGFSRSFVQQRFFATLGAYVGERQKLDGNLHVGDTIPSTLTGELPVTKSYHAGWGFGISYRFTSTKDPQKDSSAPAKQPAKK